MEIEVEVITKKIKKVVKFDPTKLKPFDKVLYLKKYTPKQEHWRIGFFERFIPKEQSGYGDFYYLMGDNPPTFDTVHNTVIPYEGNEELVFEDKLY